MTKQQERITRLKVGAELMAEGVGRDGCGWKASIIREKLPHAATGAPRYSGLWTVTIEYSPEYIGAEPFRLRREFTHHCYVGDFLYHQ